MAITRKGYFGTWGTGKQKGVMQAALYYMRGKRQISDILPPIPFDNLIAWYFSSFLQTDYIVRNAITGNWELIDYIGDDSNRIPEEGKCYLFNGIEYITVNSAIKIKNGLRIECYIKTSSTAFQMVVYNSKNSTTNSIQFGVQEGGGIRFGVQINSNFYFSLNDTNLIADGKIHKISGYIDNDLLYIEIDDQLITPTFEVQPTEPILQVITENIFYIGRQDIPTTATWGLNGSIGGLKINDSHFFKCDEGNSGIAYDSSGNGNDGVITNAVLSTFHAKDNSFFSYQNAYGYSKSGNVFIPRDESKILNDVLGNALEFSGRVKYNALIANTSIVEFDDNDDVIKDVCSDCQSFLRDSFKLTTWVRPSDGRPPSTRAFWGVEDPASTDFAIFRLTNNGYVRFSYQVNSVLVEAETTFRFQDGQNSNFTKLEIEVVKDQTMKIFVNGVQNGTIGDMSTVTMGDFTTAYNIWIGGYNRANFLFNRIPSAFCCFKMENDNGVVTHYDFGEGNGTIIYDKSGNNNHGICENITESTFWSNNILPETRPNNLLDGFELYYDSVSKYIRVPYTSNGSKITPTIAGYTKISNNDAGNWYNNAESVIKNYVAPELLEADFNSDAQTNYMYTDPGEVAQEISYGDITADIKYLEVPQHRIFANVSQENKKKDYLVYSQEQSNNDLIDILFYLNSIELLQDSQGVTLKDQDNNALYVYKNWAI